MASEYADPKAPQAEMVTSKGTNDRARVDAYTDTSITKRNVDSSPAPALDVPPPSGSTTLGNIRPVYSADQAKEIDQVASNPSVDPPPASPNSWRMRTYNGRRYPRDPYANEGLDEYQRNQGE